MILYIFIGIVVLLLIYTVIAYNNFIQLRIPDNNQKS